MVRCKVMQGDAKGCEVREEEELLILTGSINDVLGSGMDPHGPC